LCDVVVRIVRQCVVADDVDSNVRRRSRSGCSANGKRNERP
jgi:hypothetical protein